MNRQIEENGKRFTWCDRTPRYYTLRLPIILGEIIEAIEFSKADDGLYYQGGWVSLPWPDKATIELTADGFIIRDRVYNLLLAVSCQWKTFSTTATGSMDG